jgi:hypothetical protein
MAIANITNNILTDSGVAISSLVSGSGTTNYISKFTASGVLGNSLIWDNGTNVGIGNTNNTYKLDVTGTGRFVGTLTLATTQYIGNLQFGTTSAASIGYDAGSGAMTYNITAGAAATSTYYNFLADGTSIVTILKGGNVGIGVTPNAWYTGNSSKALQIGVAGVGIWGYGSTTNINTYLTNNAYYDSVGWKYAQASGKASFYQQNNGLHIWSTTDTTGTAAGDVLSFTQRMTITSGGNVGINTSSPAAKLHVDGNQYITNGTIFCDTFSSYTGGATNTSINFGGSGNLLFNSGSTERMRITTTDVLVGTTTNTINSSNFGIRLATDGTFQNSRNAGAGGGVFFTYGNAGQMFVYGNGNVVNTNNSYGPVSDIKLKENIIDTTPKLDKLMQVRIVNYNLIQYPEQNLLGVIAQELEQVFPSLVDEHIDKDEEGNDLETTTKSVKMSVFVPILIKAMQEQQAQIEELKALINK